MGITRYQKFYREHRDKRKKQSLDYAKSTGYKDYKRYWEKPENNLKLYGKSYRDKFKNAVFELLGKECKKCGFSDMRALQIDHVNGGGVKEIKKNKGVYYKFVLTDAIANPNKYQILCANCNWIKRSINNENRKK